MPRNPKLFVRGTLLELSARVEEGLPFVPNKLIKTLVINALARAQSLYPVSLVNYIIMTNHFHMLIVVKDPRDVPKFLEYFKRETATYINKLLGRKKRTIWSKGYDSPVILDYEMAIKRLKYTYLNPVTAGLCKRAKDWRLSSLDAPKEITVKRIPRNKVPKLPHREMSLSEIEIAVLKLGYRGKESYTLKIEPDAWVNCFTESKNMDQIELNKYLLNEIRQAEKILEEEREIEVPKMTVLATRNMRAEYQPTKFGKKMLCLGSSKEIRIKFLGWYKDQCKGLPRFMRKVKDTCIQMSHYPPGFFAPGGFLSSNILPRFAPFAEIG